MENKLIYEFSSHKTDGEASLSNLLGSKGANLAEMSKLGIEVPPGFTITTEVCNYFSHNNHLPDGLNEEIVNCVRNLESFSNKSLGEGKAPLL